MRIAYLIRSLEIGGAERQMTALAKGMVMIGHEVSVAIFYAGGELEADLDGTGVRLISLDKNGRWDVFGFVWRLICHLRRERPELLHSFLGTANILAALLRPLIFSCKVVWGMRSSNMDLAHYGRLSRWSWSLERYLSRFAHKVVANSHAGAEYAVSQGFPEKCMDVVWNGIDMDRFQPRGEVIELREEWGVGRDAQLVGLVARVDPMKDHETFIRAAARVSVSRPKARFVCVGSDPGNRTPALDLLAVELGMKGKLIWAGPRQNMPEVYAALDVLCLSSAYGEGFPNVVGEAMACGVPCVVTDVGDAAKVLGGMGEVANVGNSVSLAGALERMLERVESKGGARRAVRARAEASFGVGRMVSAMAAIYESV